MLNVLELRNRGIKAIDEEIAEKGIATLSYRGKPKYVIVDIDEYERLRELELMLAYSKAKEDIQKGNVEIIKTEKELDNHIEELKKSIKE